VGAVNFKEESLLDLQMTQCIGLHHEQAAITDSGKQQVEEGEGTKRRSRRMKAEVHGARVQDIKVRGIILNITSIR